MPLRLLLSGIFAVVNVLCIKDHASNFYFATHAVAGGYFLFVQKVTKETQGRSAPRPRAVGAPTPVTNKFVAALLPPFRRQGVERPRRGRGKMAAMRCVTHMTFHFG